MGNKHWKFIKLLVLATLLIVVLVFSADGKNAPVKTNLEFGMIMGALGGLFILVLLIERSTEILIAIWREGGAEELKLEIDSLKSDPTKAAELAAAQKKLVTYQAQTKSNALLIGFSISIIACAGGIGILETIVDTNSSSFMRGIDIVLTSGLLAGGSDAFHQFVRALESVFTELKKTAKP